MSDRTVAFAEEAWEILEFQAQLLGVSVDDLVRTRAIPGPGVTLSFGGDPDEVEKAETAIKADRWKSVANGMDQWLRGKIKWPPDGQAEAATEAFQGARKHLTELLNDEGLELW